MPSEITKYQCDQCESAYDTYDEAEACEAGHAAFATGHREGFLEGFGAAAVSSGYWRRNPFEGK
jgi:hypothetical protein